MSVAAHFYATPLLHVFGANPINYLSDTMKVMLTTSLYSPNQTTDAFQSDVTHEVSGTGYSSGGLTLASKTLTYSSSTGIITFTAANASWPSSTITARTAVIYDATPGSPSTNPLFAYYQSSVDITTTSGTFLIAWDSTGLATITLT